MPKKNRRVSLSVVFVAALAVILIALATVQYDWIGQISAADRERMKLALDGAVSQFVQDFLRELQRPGMVFRPDGRLMATRDWDRYAERYDDWLRIAPDPELLANVYLLDFEHDRLLRLDPSKGRWQAVRPPAHLEPVLRKSEPGLGPEGPRRRPWTLHEEIPALTHLQVRLRPPAREGDPPRATAVGLLILEVRGEYLWRKLAPELAARHFARGSFEAAIFDGDRVLFRSGPSIQREGPADARIKLLAAAPEPGRFILPESGDGRWELVVRHRGGSLDAVVDALRLRNLAISFGVLLLLAVAMAMVMASTRRAQRLARLQMDFVAGVSHELRTPLAVIVSAGDNLAEGVIEANPRVQQYGALVRDQARRLRAMVEQILAFAAGEAGRRYELRPVAVAPLIEQALAESHALVASAGATVERHIDSGLPNVVADEGALKQCLENLIGNAVKYGGERKWLSIAADAHGEEVRITVADRGLGIDRAELEHIFDPFYRGQMAVAAQIRGTGLGLSLAKNVVEAMGGRISVESTPGQGSAFTLHLRASKNGAA